MITNIIAVLKFLFILGTIFYDDDKRSYWLSVTKKGENVLKQCSEMFKAWNEKWIGEIVNVKTINGISDEEFINIINNLDTKFLYKTKGYIDTELIKGKEEQSWIIIIHWRTMEEGNEALTEFANSPLTEEYRTAIDPRSVGFHFAEQVQTWKAV